MRSENPSGPVFLPSPCRHFRIFPHSPKQAARSRPINPDRRRILNLARAPTQPPSISVSGFSRAQKTIAIIVDYVFGRITEPYFRLPGNDLHMLAKLLEIWKSADVDESRSAFGMPKALSISCASSTSGNDSLLQVRRDNQFHNQFIQIFHGIGELFYSLAESDDRAVRR